MTTLDNYLFFDGQCADAMRFYEKVLGGKLETVLTYGQSPDPGTCPPGSADRVMHACIKMPSGRLLMASDSPAGMHKPMQGFGVAVTFDTAAEARKAFDSLLQGGQVDMPMGKTFWTEAFGALTDRFGTPWMIGGGEQYQVG